VTNGAPVQGEVVSGADALLAAGSNRFWVLSATVVLIFMTGVEGTVVATAMPTIVSQLGGFDLFSWVFSAYFLSQGVTIPIYGRLADLFGRKRVLFFGLTLFLAGTLLCGFAQNMAVLVAFRALQGLGAGAVQPINQTLIGDLYPPAMRARMAGFFSSIWGIAAIVGPVLGAFVIAQVGWTWVFWVTVPIGVAAFLLLAFALRERVERRAHRIDYLGSLLLSLGIGLLMYAFIEAKDIGAVGFLGLLFPSALILALFVRHERRAAEPILPLGLWRNGVITCGFIGCFCVGAVVMASTTFLPAYIQGVMGESPIVAGYALAVSSVTWIAGSAGGGRIMLRFSYRAATLIGAAFLVVGIGMLIALDPARGPLWAAVGTSLVGVGMGLTQNTYTVAAQSCVDWSQRGTATALIAFSRMFGQTIGTAIYGGAVNLTLSGLIGGDAVSRIMEPGLRDNLPAAQFGPVMLAVADAIRNVYLVAGCFVLMCLAAGLALPKGLSPTRRVSEHRPN
jgi:EmrB/QacA subfamily drug resistance transporter